MGVELGVFLLGVGSGGVNILSRAYIEYDTIRKSASFCFCINSSERDFRRVRERFKKAHMKRMPKRFVMRVVGPGFGAGKDAEKGLEMYREESTKILDEIEAIYNKHRFAIGFSIGCLGGGFGSLTLAEVTRDVASRLGIPIIPMATLPRRGEGELLLENARKGLAHLIEFGLPPILYDNERAGVYSPSIGVAMMMANRVIAGTIAGLVDAVEYSEFAVPPIDIRDVTRIIKRDCAVFTSMRTEDVHLLKSWKEYLMRRNLSLETEPIDKSSVFCIFQGPEFPKTIADDISKYLRWRYKARDAITSALEGEAFKEYSITALIYGMSLEKIKPKLEPMKSLKERLFG